MRPVRSRPDGDGVLVVAAAVVLLLDAREQEDLVVHRQAEGDAEHEDRGGGVDGAGGGEVEDTRQVPSWKTHTMAPNVADRLSTLSTSALSGMTHAAEHHEQQHEGDDGDDAGGQRQPAEQRRLGVDAARPTGR